MNCGLLGRTLGHSWSPAIHGLLGDYAYSLFEKEPQDVAEFIRTGPWDGLNVTIPYKKDVARLCDECSPLAKELGSVNTLVRRNGKIFGDNTDAWGFQQMLSRVQVEVSGKKALVLGSGGASVTVQAVLKHAGAEVVVISRQGENNYCNIPNHADARILVNTTPVGMYPKNGESPVDLEVFPKLEAVLDVVYNPARTKLILDAMARGIPCESGLFMLVGQAARASELWTGKEIPREKLTTVWKTVAAAMENIILIGMPGCGKTVLGRALGKKLGREFVDADAVFVRRFGNIPAFFAKYGEEAFRREESRILAELGKRSGLVISTGGGCVTRWENREVLQQNGRVIWIRRPLEALPTEGRPLSQRNGIAALYEERKSLYAAFCHGVVENTGTIEEGVEQCIFLF